jgi:hypothetical protein
VLSPVAAPLLAKAGGNRVITKTISAAKPIAAIHVATEAPIVAPSFTASDITVERKEGAMIDAIEYKENCGAIANVTTETVGEAKRGSMEASDKKPMAVDIKDITLEIDADTNTTTTAEVPQVPLLAIVRHETAAVLYGMMDTIVKSDKHATTTTTIATSEAKDKEDNGAMANVMEATVGETKRSTTEASSEKKPIAVNLNDIKMETDTNTNAAEANTRQETAAVLTNILDPVITADKSEAKESKKGAVDVTLPSA